MLSAIQFPAFVVLALVFYFITPKKQRWLTLLVASYFYYWLAGGWFAVGIISLTVVNVYIAGLLCGRLLKLGSSRSVRRIPLALCLVTSFSMLAFFKYGAFWFNNSSIFLITGVSFYTFQAAGYLIDVYGGKISPEKNIFRFALFISFFPQLVQGPISRHSEMAQGLYAGSGWDFERARSGIQRIIRGYFMKLLIADYAVVIVDRVFSDYDYLGGAIIIVSLFFYSVQIYADFAGGINIAVGIAQIVGVRLPENFKQPYFANSLSDFWRRWHITLGTWLKDYLFYPLALSKTFTKLGRLTRKWFGVKYGRLIPTSLATMVVYAVVGIWHGSSLKYAAFGLYNGGIITLSLFCEGLYSRLRAKTGISGNTGFGKFFAMTRTFVLVLFSQYFARGASLKSALGMIKRTFTHFQLPELWNGMLLNLGLSARDYIVFALSLSLLIIYDIICERGNSPEELLDKSKPALQFIVLFVVLSCITLFGIYREGYVASEFIYANF